MTRSGTLSSFARGWTHLIYDATFHELPGERNAITIITDGEKDNLAMGFSLTPDVPSEFPIRPEAADDDDTEIPMEPADEVHGVEIP